MTRQTVLYLGPPSPVCDFLRESHVVTRHTGVLKHPADVDWLISYGYRHILKKPILDRFPDRAVNLHISYLPWNRGADPNLWSWADGTPKGVTIHYLDEGVDTGDIIAQRAVAFDRGERTLAQTFERLHAEIQALFFESWPSILAGTCGRTRQIGGNSHRTSDRAELEPFLVRGLDTEVSEFDTRAEELWAAVEFRNAYVGETG